MSYFRLFYNKFSKTWIGSFQLKQFKSTHNVQNIRNPSSSQKFANPFPNLNRNPETRNVKKDIDGIALLLLCIPISTFYLGTWQVKRKKWKEDLIESLTVTTKIPAIDLPANDEEVEDMEFRRVRVKGEFDHSGEMYLGPRSCLIDGESTGGSLLSTSTNSGIGYYVVTPFILSDSKERILVNRGWVSLPHKDPKKRLNGQIEGEVELEGIIRKTEPKGRFVPPDLPKVRIFPSRNVEDMAKMAETKPIFLDATVESSVDGGPIGGQTRTSLRNEHLSYIITWYSLSAATAFMWCRKYLLKK